MAKLKVGSKVKTLKNARKYKVDMGRRCEWNTEGKVIAIDNQINQILVEHENFAEWYVVEELELLKPTSKYSMISKENNG